MQTLNSNNRSTHNGETHGIESTKDSLLSPKVQAAANLLSKYLGHDKDALLFGLSYVTYCHAIDDIIDGDKKDYEHILKTFDFAATIFSSPFYVRNLHLLYPLVKSASNSFADSVTFERSGEVWSEAMADVLRQQGNEVLCAVVEIVSGIDAKRAFSKEARKLGYDSHHDSFGRPI